MEPFIGMIIQFAGNFAPRGWAFCNGQLMAIASNSALFSILGTTYGGDGHTTFALPDLRGRVPIHAGQGPGLSDYRLGQSSGAEMVTLTINNLPSHNHSLHGTSTTPNQVAVANNVLASGVDGDPPMYSSATPNAQLNAGAVGNTGNGQPASIVQPYLAINFIIALQGLFPSHN